MVRFSMTQTWKSVPLASLKENVFHSIGDDWMLVTAGTTDHWNTMTASWGGFGVLWNLNVSFCFVRPTRHTYEFMERADRYTLSFYDEDQRDALDFCGSRSGRDVDKAAETGLVPSVVEGAIAFEQARLVLVCRKLYHHDIDPDRFIDPSIDSHYPDKDYHRGYIGEVVSCLSK